MEKQTLRFASLTDLSAFVRQVTYGYLINTNNLTVTAKLPEEQVQLALTLYNAAMIDTNEKVFSYDLLWHEKTVRALKKAKMEVW